MPGKRHKLEDIVTKLPQVEMLFGKGVAPWMQFASFAQSKRPIVASVNCVSAWETPTELLPSLGQDLA
jgi:hypothetical protein